MNTKTKIITVALLATLSVPGIASAQGAIFLPPSYTAGQAVPNDFHAQAPTQHRGSRTHRSYGQW